ncbi:DsbA family protein [Mechercharimyces sp. CAU 1602]|uniref:DsbA family protein n=1 Tax=Mechercharimyces sp. CAU 1602 TaxID=2973933 RepID=UPI002163919F|nr:DsbA family protein [Mechercharimyces sp. CAU 1602]MCS1352630.1 DsbA family protein [Mechercharimyces sp. CAU 1602]
MSNKKERLEKKQEAARKRRMQTMMISTIVIVLVAAIAFLVFSQEDAADAPAFTFAADNQQFKGEENAPVTVVKFGDFKCPHCKTVYDSVLPQLQEEYIDKGKVKFQFMNLPVVSEDSNTAAQAGEAIYAENPDAFWKYYDYLYSNQGDPHEIWATKEYILDVINKEKLDVDANKVAEALDEKTYVKEVNLDKQEATKAGLKSVPALFVNGKLVEDPYDFDSLRTMIEAELK